VNILRAGERENRGSGKLLCYVKTRKKKKRTPYILRVKMCYFAGNVSQFPQDSLKREKNRKSRKRNSISEVIYYIEAEQSSKGLPTISK